MTLLPAFVSVVPAPGGAPLLSPGGMMLPMGLDGFAAMISEVTAAEPLLTPGAAAILVTKATVPAPGVAAIAVTNTTAPAPNAGAAFGKNASAPAPVESSTAINLAAPAVPALPEAALIPAETQAALPPLHSDDAATAMSDMAQTPETPVAHPKVAEPTTKDAVIKPVPRGMNLIQAAVSLAPAIPAEPAMPHNSAVVAVEAEPSLKEAVPHSGPRKLAASDDTPAAPISARTPAPLSVAPVTAPALAPASPVTTAAKTAARASNEDSVPATSSNSDAAPAVSARIATAQSLETNPMRPEAAPGFADRVEALNGPAGNVRATQSVGRGRQLPDTISARPQEMGRELGVAIARHQLEGVDEISLRLDPGEMGKVHVRLHFEDGTLRAHVRTESYAALDLIRREAGDLNRALGDAGIRTDGGSFRFESGSQQQHSQQHARHQQPTTTTPMAFANQDFVDEAPIHQTVRASGRVDVMA